MAIIIFILGSSPKAYSDTRTEGLHIIHHVGLYNIGPFCQFGSLPFVTVCLSWICSLVHMHMPMRVFVKLLVSCNVHWHFCTFISQQIQDKIWWDVKGEKKSLLMWFVRHKSNSVSLVKTYSTLTCACNCWNLVARENLIGFFCFVTRISCKSNMFITAIVDAH